MTDESWHWYCCWSCWFGTFATESYAISFNPCLPKLLSIEVVNKKVCWRVEADKEVWKSHDDIHHRNFTHCTIVAQISTVSADNQLVQIRNNLKGLAENEQGRHSDENNCKWMFFLLFLNKCPSWLNGSQVVTQTILNWKKNHRWWKILQKPTQLCLLKWKILYS